ncbi:cation:proton antiporter [Aurantimonas sp. Leaf443]|uniref:cation:proton antiporter domain-containing protein n=1 Tax=Aurantimonas sp. Leaf443 TaxID=1736378 RepID=UPI0009E96CB9|nr:cation:proton antiporter [Aurantimonas sp. Leaf443]
MPHETPLISTIVAGLVLAFILGAIANRFRLPPLVGYLVAGILVGPHTPGYVADQNLAPELAEIGVILLMFGVGLHFSLKDLLSVRGIAIPGALVQIAFATLLGWGLGAFMGWPLGGSLVFGLALSVASTVVLLKALQERRLLETDKGKVAVGWLIVEDLAMVLALVLIPAVASVSMEGGHASDPMALAIGQLLGVDLGLAGIIGATILKVAIFVALMLVVGRKLIPWGLHRIVHTGSRELFRLAVLAIALGVAYGAAQLFGVSLALGAFFAGMILAESELSHRAAQESLPLRDAFAVLFFVSVGMLFDPSIVLTDPLPVLATVFIIVIGKSLAAFVIVLLFRRTVGTALAISASLAQIGEFSFILAELGVGLQLLPEEGRDLILAGAIISIILNPLVFWLSERMKPSLEARLIRAAPRAATAEAGLPASPEHPELTIDRAIAPAELAGTSEPETGAAAEPEPEPEAEPAAPAHLPGADGEAGARTDLENHTILVGFGRVGSLVGEDLKASGAAFLVIEDADARIDILREKGIEVVVGNAASRAVMDLANLPGARSLVIAIPNAFESGNIAEHARQVNPDMRIIVRAHSDAEVEHLERLGADTVIMGEREIARGMIGHLNAIEEPLNVSVGPGDVADANDDPEVEQDGVADGRDGERTAPPPASDAYDEARTRAG